MTSGHEVARQEAPSFGIPMHAGAADPVAEHECAPIAHRQRRFVRLVAERHRHLRRPQEQLVADAVAKLVLHVGDREVGGGVAPRAALDRNHIQARIRQFVGEDRSGPAESDNGNVLARKLSGHARSRREPMNYWDQFG
jgi:hypothetical protein